MVALDLIDPAASAVAVEVNSDYRRSRHIDNEQFWRRVPIRMKAIDRPPPDF